MVKKSKQAYKNIREASQALGLEPHVLRFWESKFDMLEPMTRGGGRRYYSPDDMELLTTIQDLVHIQGMTIRAANRLIKAEGIQSTNSLTPPKSSQQPIKQSPKTSALPQSENSERSKNIAELEEFDAMLDGLEQRAQNAIQQCQNMLQKIKTAS